MLPEQLGTALAELEALDYELQANVQTRWREGGSITWGWVERAELPESIAAAADLVNETLRQVLSMKDGAAELAPLLKQPAGKVLLDWCAASNWRSDLDLAGLLRTAARVPACRDRVIALARTRIVCGPLLDALRCVPLLRGDELNLPENAEARARLEILFWEAGASGFEVAELGPWVWSSAETFEAVIAQPARSALRGRVVAARGLEVCAGGMPQTVDPELMGKTLQVLQPLLLHPEPLVWIHAARALGRLTGVLEQLEPMLLDWVNGEQRVLRQRSMTAFASLPAERLRSMGSMLRAIIDSKSEDAWVLAAIAAATPYLFYSRPDLWSRLSARVLAGDGGAIAARALARGLIALWRRGIRGSDVELPLRTLRELARRAKPEGLEETRRWIEIIAVTDLIDDAERDPLDLELGLENLIRVAAQYDDEEADARAARFAGALAPALQEARRLALSPGRVRHRGAALNALEGCARALALRLWAPLLATNPRGEALEEPDLGETWTLLAASPAEMLDLVRERRHDADADEGELVALEISAIRLGGYALDACGEGAELGPGRGRAAHDTCLWLRKIEGLADGTRELPGPLQSAIGSLFWRLVDTTRGTALGEVDDVSWLGPFAAWWALVIDRPAVLLQLATALPLIDASKLALCCERAEALREAVSSGEPNGQWGPAVAAELETLCAEDTELNRALRALAAALEAFEETAGNRDNLEPLCERLVTAGDRLQAALADPVKALHFVPAGGASMFPRAEHQLDPNVHRIAALVARAIRVREPSLLDVWFASLGPVASSLLEMAVRGAISRTPPPPRRARKEPELVEGYELVKTLGEGGIGSVCLVRKPGADRLFVLKIPKAEALANATDQEREGILASFVEEARALAGLYHPNVANIIDRGVANNMPYLVLEYLIGADLKEYSTAKLMSLFELRQVVIESCAGLAALHNAGLVHRDIKPANLWLRLPLAGGQRFDPSQHRDPAVVHPLSTVVIDFGMVRAIRIPAEASGRFVAGTAGYIAPEQVLDPVELHPNADVYSLVGTIYNVTTGRAFFDDIDSPRDRILAHMRRDPFEDLDRLKGFPSAVAKLMRAGAAMNPADRPSPLELGREFAAAL